MTTAATARPERGSCCGDPEDADWSRMPGAEPPLRSWIPAALAAMAALVLTLVGVPVVRPPGPLDDPTAGDQRDGLLLDGPVLPAQVGPSVDVVRLPGTHMLPVDRPWGSRT